MFILPMQRFTVQPVKVHYAKLRESPCCLRMRSQTLSRWFDREYGSLKAVAPEETILKSGVGREPQSCETGFVVPRPPSRTRGQTLLHSRSIFDEASLRSLPSLPKCVHAASDSEGRGDRSWLSELHFSLAKARMQKAVSMPCQLS